MELMAGHDEDKLSLDIGPAFLVAVVLNTTYVAVEALFGFWIGSLALLADAAHNLTDVFGLLIAWGAFVVGRRRPTKRHTYGLGRATILAALANGIALLIGVGALVREAIGRIAAPEPVAATTILGVAAIGIAIKSGTALLFGTFAGYQHQGRIPAYGGGCGGFRRRGRLCNHYPSHRLDGYRSGHCHSRKCRDCLVGFRPLEISNPP